MLKKLNPAFYQEADVLKVAHNLLGKQLWTNFNNVITSGIIVEVEAYCGATDKACHAYPDKKTPRTMGMYENGGAAYIYLIYGMYHLFNIVTNTNGSADAVLIRAIEPAVGKEIIFKRRNTNKRNWLLSGGPGRLSQALGITTKFDGTDLQGDTIWLTDGIDYPENEIMSSQRIGVESAGEAAHYPWRFYIKGNKYVSK